MVPQQYTCLSADTAWEAGLATLRIRSERKALQFVGPPALACSALLLLLSHLLKPWGEALAVTSAWPGRLGSHCHRRWQGLSLWNVVMPRRALRMQGTAISGSVLSIRHITLWKGRSREQNHHRHERAINFQPPVGVAHPQRRMYGPASNIRLSEQERALGWAAHPVLCGHVIRYSLVVVMAAALLEAVCRG